MSLLMKVALDADLPSAYSIEEEVEAICHYTTGASRGTIEVSLAEGDRSIDKARRAVSSVARKHGATIVSERKMDDSVSFKLSKPIAQDADDGKWVTINGSHIHLNE